MSQRGIRINSAHVYSNNLNNNLSKPSNTIKSLNKVEAITTAKTVVQTGYNPSKTSITQEKEKYKIKPHPKIAQEVGKRVTIVIRSQKQEKKRGDLADNFQYYESKNLSKKNKESIVIHKRKENPLYQSITNQRNSKYTIGQRNGATFEKKENKINTIETRTQRNQYQNKTYNSINIIKTTQERKNRITNANINNNESSNKRTINVEERRKNIPTKIHFENIHKETNKRKTTNVEQKQNINVPVKFQQKKEETKKTSISQEQNIKEETGNFLCPNCGYKLFGATYKTALEKWICRENNGIKKYIFYGIDNTGVGNHDYYWYGKMEKVHHDSWTDSGTSCGIKRNIHIGSWTESVFKKNDSIESCWKEAFTEKKWNENMGKFGCLFCGYLSNFIDFIKAKRRQAKQ